MYKVTIITCCYNASETILDVINILKEQSYPVQHIIIDGNSSDGTQSIIKQNKMERSIFISEPDKGFYDAVNKGLKLATGDIIGILNADDFYTSNTVIEEVVKFFKSNPKIEASYSNLYYVDFKETNKIIRKWKSQNYYSGLFLNGWMPAHPTFFVKRSVYEQYGHFRLDMGTAADYEIMLRFIHKCNIKVGYLDKWLIKMRLGGMSNSGILARFKANKNDKKAWVENGLNPKWYTLILKPLSKIKQFI